MTRDESIRLAALNQPMPQGLDLIDALLFQAMAFLYGRHREEQITIERAKQDKQAILEIYDRLTGKEGDIDPRNLGSMKSRKE